jgi:hypothetical protein
MWVSTWIKTVNQAHSIYLPRSMQLNLNKKKKGGWTWCRCFNPLLFSSPALWRMKTKPTYPGWAFTPLPLLLLPLARASLSLSMASHHCESFRNSWHALMNWLERLEQGVSDEKEIKQWIYLNSSWNSRGALLSNATECFKHQIKHWDSFLVLRRRRLISNYGAIESREGSKIGNCRKQ